MQLNWLDSNTDKAPDGVLSQSGNHVLHRATCQAVDELAIKNAVIETAHKAAQLLVDNIEDDSLYLLFIWEPEHSLLTAVVTDDTKQNDAVHVVRCDFPESTASTHSIDDPFSSSLSFWIRDYLTTSSEYMRFSLVALFTDSTRDVTGML